MSVQSFTLTPKQVGLISSLIPTASWKGYVLGYDGTNLMVQSSLGALIEPIVTVSGWDITASADQAKVALIQYAQNTANILIATMKSYGTLPVLKADRTASTVTDLLAIIADATTNPTDVYNWVANDNSVTSLTAAQIAALAPSVAGDRKAIYSTYATAISNINSGTITTTAQIDALSWPT